MGPFIVGPSARRALLLAGGLLLATLVAWGGIQTWRLHRAQGQVHEAGLAYENAKAVADSTRALRGRDSLELARVYGDSVRAVQRLVVQAAIQRDALSKQLGTVAHAVSVLTATVDVLRIAAESTDSTREDSSGTRRASFDVRKVPYTVHADVSLPRVGRGSLDSLFVAVDPARLVPRLECGNKNAFGIRPAQIVVVTPTWLRALVDSATVDPATCNPVTKPEGHWSLAATLGASLVTARDSTGHRRWYAGPGATIGGSYRIGF